MTVFVISFLIHTHLKYYGTPIRLVLSISISRQDFFCYTCIFPTHYFFHCHLLLFLYAQRNFYLLCDLSLTT